MIATTGLIRILAQEGYDIYVSAKESALNIIRMLKGHLFIMIRTLLSY